MSKGRKAKYKKQTNRPSVRKTPKRAGGRDRKPSGKPSRPQTENRLKVRGKIDRGGRRWWTDDERGLILAALAANGGKETHGAIALTAKATGCPYDTLYAWAHGSRCPEALRLQNDKKGELAAAAEELAWLMAAIIPEKVFDAPLNHLTAGFGTMVDKALLLRDRPTSRVVSEQAPSRAVTNFVAFLETCSDEERVTVTRVLGRFFRPSPDGGTGGGGRTLGPAEEVPEEVPPFLA